nr:hypothetical protein [Caballeronia sordidicola]
MAQNFEESALCTAIPFAEGMDGVQFGNMLGSATGELLGRQAA